MHHMNTTTHPDLGHAATAHLRKSLRVLHQALAVSEKAGHDEAVIGPLRLAIWQVHEAIRQTNQAGTFA
jgi:hypothetical protein